MSDASEEFQTFNLYVQDESRFGLFTRNGKALTAVGVKPICTYQNVFINQPIYLVRFHPIMGIAWLWNYPIVMGIIFKYS